MLNSTIVIVDVWFPQNASSTIDNLLATSNAVSFEESNNVSFLHMYKNTMHAVVNFDVGCVMCHMYCVERLLLCTYSMHVTEFA